MKKQDKNTEQENTFSTVFPSSSPFILKETQKHFEKNRWPPVWFLKEEDRYLRSQKERKREEEIIRKLHTKRGWCFWRHPSSSAPHISWGSDSVHPFKPLHPSPSSQSRGM